MKKLLALLLVCTAATAFAENYFPGLKVVLTPQEFARAGLDKLTADQLGVVDAAIIRHYVRTIENVAVQKEINVVTGNESESTWLSRFGLPDLGSDWRERTGIKARCTGWVGGNAFRLDNAQVWEGAEPIPLELVGKEIEIQPRPGGSFALIVEGKNTTIRVRRTK
jgi:hypothetical protein